MKGSNLDFIIVRFQALVKYYFFKTLLQPHSALQDISTTEYCARSAILSYFQRFIELASATYTTKNRKVNCLDVERAECAAEMCYRLK